MLVLHLKQAQKIFNKQYLKGQFQHKVRIVATHLFA